MLKWIPIAVAFVALLRVVEIFTYKPSVWDFIDHMALEQDQDAFPARCSAICGFTHDDQPLHCLQALNATQEFCRNHQYQCNFVYTRHWGVHVVGDRCAHRQSSETGMCFMHQSRGRDVAAIEEHRIRHAQHEADRRLMVRETTQAKASMAQTW